YRLSPDGQVEAVLDNLFIPNGLVYSADGALAYFIDTGTHAVRVYEVDEDGSWGAMRIVADLAGRSPDGMTIDAAGPLWVALWGCGPRGVPRSGERPGGGVDRGRRGHTDQCLRLRRGGPGPAVHHHLGPGRGGRTARRCCVRGEPGSAREAAGTVRRLNGGRRPRRPWRMEQRPRIRMIPGLEHHSLVRPPGLEPGTQ